MGYSATLGRRIAVLTALVLGAVVVPVTATGAATGGQTVRTTIHVPAMVLDNLCNGAEPVALSGDLFITTRTTPDSRGGYSVQSSADGHDLQGQGLVSLLGYEGDSTEDSDAYYAPPPYPSRQSVTHSTRLVPKGAAPSMYLVFQLTETVTADGSVIPTLDRTYLTCHGPGS